ncbi:hypothetical protein [Flavobacterium sp. JP2137]|uniref:hypothetical protein n=1 Tax=Flavobacterium sp. JP2137 TaxID=3414510 RepID=UPI003D2FC875
MKVLSLIVLGFFINFLALPTIAVAFDMDLNIPTISISEENKKPITNTEEEHHPYNIFDYLSDWGLDRKATAKNGSFDHINDKLPRLNIREIPDPPPDLA